MTISKFWNQAFIAALARLPAEEAKLEADKALSIAIAHWQAVKGVNGNVVPIWILHADQRLEDVNTQQGS